MRDMHCLVLFMSLALFIPSSRAAEKPQLWLYYPTNLLVNENVDKAEKIWTQAAAAGYTHVLIGDSKFSRLPTLDRGYFKNCERAKKIAAELKLQLVPALFSIGYSNDLLSQDPNLAEGLPVKDQLFVVKDGKAELAPDPAIHFGKISFHDSIVAVDGNLATVKAGKGPARFVYNLNVPQFRCYHISVKVKSNLAGASPEIAVLSGDNALQFEFLHIKKGEWSQCNVVFDSLSHTDVNVYFGIWNDVKGGLQWKDWSIEEIGLVNVLRRPGAPCVVKEDKTGKELKEGSDYEPIVDPMLGNVPFAGGYQSYHQPPAIRTKLADGKRLRVSWYYPPVVYDEQVAACISEPKAMALLADQAKRMKEIWNAPLYMMSHDEFRAFGWDGSCETRKKTPGQMLAENVRDCTKLLAPARAAVWNDMFDPFHNAVKGPYYLVNGPWLDSWEGLSKDILIVNWNHGKRDQSLKFFADRGNKQLIAGYYDSDLSELQEWIDSASKVSGVEGYMYTTWRGDYSMMEKFARMALK